MKNQILLTDGTFRDGTERVTLATCILWYMRRNGLFGYGFHHVVIALGC